MEKVEMNNMYINIDANNGSEKCTEKTLRLLKDLALLGSWIQEFWIIALYCDGCNTTAY